VTATVETPAEPVEPARPRSARPALLLAVCCAAQFLVILDLSIVNVALPSIQVGLRFSSADLQWVVDAYAIFFAGFLMLAGRSTDVFGQRRTFIVALLTFTAASIVGGLAPTSGVLIAARAVQGLGGALLAASSLTIITSSFEAGPERNRAIALWGAMNGAGGATGTVLGGVITQEASWRWVLLINAPIGLTALVVARAVVTERRAPARQGFDLLGAAILTGSLLIGAYGAVTAGSEGWTSPHALVPIAVGALLGAAFPVVERRAAAPLVPPGAFTRSLRTINAIVLLFSAAIFPMWYIGSLYLQQVLALSPLETGLVFLPMALAIFACASQAGKVVGRAGVRSVLGCGLLLMAAGMAMTARIQPSGSAVQYILLPGLLTAVGIGFSVVASTIAATQGAEPGRAGLASGLVNTSRQVGGGLGLAVVISIATQYTSHLIGGSRAVPEALTAGFRLGYLIVAGLAASAAVLAFALLPRPHAQGQGRVARRVLGVALAVAACFAAVVFGVPRSHAAPIGTFTTNGAYSYVSAPGLHPPRIQLSSTSGPPKLPGYVMLGNFYDLTDPPIVGQSGPLMLDDRLQPVWFHPAPVDVVGSNLQAQTYHGEPVLTWWQGVVTPTGEISSGEDIVVDRHYQPVARLEGADGWVLTLHELVIDGDNAWVTANRNVPADLAKYGGVNHGTVVESAIQKYDLRTGRLLYTWNAGDHIPLSDSHTQPPPNGFPWDAYHVNSLSPGPDGTFLVSMRNTWAVYLVDAKTGAIEWTLGGKHSSFTIPDGERFEWQHDAQLHGGSLVSLFDNHCCQVEGTGKYLPATGSSRVLMLRIDTANHRVTRAAEYSHGATFAVQYMGNGQMLPDGDVFVGWGQVPYFSEFAKSGKLLFDGIMPSPNMSYRAYVQPWVGEPLTRPRGGARTDDGGTTVYASWNGATKLVSWRVLAGDAAGALTAVATRAKSGFETAIPVPSGSTRFEVQALDAAGRVIGTSMPFRATA
jgi:EmrB/QacA subfamily drug resistance transporter